MTAFYDRRHAQVSIWTIQASGRQRHELVKLKYGTILEKFITLDGGQNNHMHLSDTTV